MAFNFHSNGVVTAALTDSLKHTPAYEHIFNNHLLKPVHQGAVFNNAYSEYWPSIVLFIAVCLLVILKVASPARTFRIFNAAYSLQVAKQIEREDYSPFKRVSVLMSLIFVLTVGFLFYKLNQLYGSGIEDSTHFSRYVFFTLMVLLVYLLKYIINTLIGFITNQVYLFREYTNNTFIINQATGGILLPIVILAELSPLRPEWFIFPGIVILCFGYALRLYRGFVFAALEEGIGFLQLFVYLCALEILPLLVLVKFLVVNYSYGG